MHPPISTDKKPLPPMSLHVLPLAVSKQPLLPPKGQLHRPLRQYVAIAPRITASIPQSNTQFVAKVGEFLIMAEHLATLNGCQWVDVVVLLAFVRQQHPQATIICPSAVDSLMAGRPVAFTESPTGRCCVLRLSHGHFTAAVAFTRAPAAVRLFDSAGGKPDHQFLTTLQ